jgi:hypothetical protein
VDDTVADYAINVVDNMLEDLDRKNDERQTKKILAKRRLRIRRMARREAKLAEFHIEKLEC